MKFIKIAFILSGLLCVRLGQADAATNHTVKGVVITSNGTVVPDFAVVVKPLTEKPELVRRLHFKDGEFSVDELPAGKYQLHISAPLFIPTRVTFDLTDSSTDTNYRIVVLHMYRNEARLQPGAAHLVSVKVLQQKVPSAAQDAYKTAVQLHREGNLEEALIQYGKAIRNYPQYIDALTDIGTVFLLYNRPEAALAFLRRAQAIDDSNVIINFNIAVALTQQGDYAGAQKLIKRILHADPRLAWAQCFSAKLEYMQKKYDEAEKHVREAIENDPRLVDALVLMIDISTQQKKHDQAREALERLREAMNNQMVTKFINEQLSGMGN